MNVRAFFFLAVAGVVIFVFASGHYKAVGGVFGIASGTPKTKNQATKAVTKGTSA